MPLRRLPSLMAATCRRLCGRLARCRNGNTAVEFAFILPALLAVVFGAIEFGRALWLRNTLQYAVEETARYAMTHADATDADLLDYAESRLEELMSLPVTLTAQRETVGGTEFAVVVASCDFAFVLPLPALGFELSGRARVPLVSS